ncbi:MAG: exopolyphosphatase [Candidatus Rokubacteria bacterium RIFCSPLOWO2_02_FULL_72_37]|nr:MAG: exopolyphosphatase [Candidatus Rokubacteria bacterium RIFCSPLOWO2_02_FULL_72_37]
MLRIANCSGFFGDRLAAAREMVEGGPIDVLTGDYLAELTMAILWRTRQKRPEAGFAATFIAQMEQVLGRCLERGIRVVVNAGGLNPRGCAEALAAVAQKLGLSPRIAYVTGDDVLDRLERWQAQGHALAHLDRGIPLAQLRAPILTANAYLGGWGIAEALGRGADVVITGRVTDASLVVGPAAWRFGWRRDDWDRLASAVVAGHILECGAQCTGGNYAFFQEVPTYTGIGFPLAEMREDGGFVVTKHPGTGGLVSVGTITAQLLYEIDAPGYLNPDVTARFDTIRLEQEAPDRVRVSGVRGEPPPPTTKLCLNYLGGYRNSVTFVLAGLDLVEKAKLVEDTLWPAVGGREAFAETAVSLVRSDREDPETNEAAFASLKITVKDPDPKKVGRAFTNKAIEMALAHYPGFHTTAPPQEESAYAVYWPALVPAELIEQVVHLEGAAARVPPVLPPREPVRVDVPAVALPPAPSGPTARVPLGWLFGTRSGDKGGNANLGVWARTPEAYAWLLATVTPDRLRQLLPECRGLAVERHLLPNILAVNFVIKGLLGEGVSSSTRSDPQAKSLGEYFRARHVEVPRALLSSSHHREGIPWTSRDATS